MRKDPTIIPLIKQIVFMGGQVYAGGNAFRDAGEFNWWFDPEAAQVVLRADVPKFIVPLDCTGKSIPYTSNPYPSIGLLTPSTVVFAIDNDAFLKFYVNLLSLPVPVDF